jgi:hypothetical protein
MSTEWENVQASDGNGFDSLRTDEQFDVSFAYYFRWDCPDVHIKEALRNLLARCAAEEADVISGHREVYEKELEHVRWLIASNPNTPPQVLDHLTKRADASLRERIAENPRVSLNTLRKLAGDSDPEVRAAVAENLNSPTDVFSLLAKDENADVRYRLAENPNLAQDLLRELAEDENPYVAHRASKTLAKLTVQPPVSGPFYTLPWQRTAEM